MRQQFSSLSILLGCVALVGGCRQSGPSPTPPPPPAYTVVFTAPASSPTNLVGGDTLAVSVTVNHNGQPYSGKVTFSADCGTIAPATSPSANGTGIASATFTAGAQTSNCSGAIGASISTGWFSSVSATPSAIVVKPKPVSMAVAGWNAGNGTAAVAPGTPTPQVTIAPSVGPQSWSYDVSETVSEFNLIVVNLEVDCPWPLVPGGIATVTPQKAAKTFTLTFSPAVSMATIPFKPCDGKTGGAATFDVSQTGTSETAKGIKVTGPAKK